MASNTVVIAPRQIMNPHRQIATHFFHTLGSNILTYNIVGKTIMIEIQSIAPRKLKTTMADGVTIARTNVI
jgi:hypothetical protein